MSLFFLLARNYYKRTKINTHFCLSVKRLKTRSLGRTVCFFADHVAQLSGDRNFQRPKLRPITDCRHCCKIFKLKALSDRSDSNRYGISTSRFSYHYSFRYLYSLWSGLSLHHSISTLDDRR